MKPGEFNSGSFPAITTFAFDKISPPSTLYIQRDDQLLVSVTSSQANEVVTIRLRLLLAPLLAGGQPSDHQQSQITGAVLNRGYVEVVEISVPVGAAFQETLKSVVLAEGYLLSAVAVSTQAAHRGETYVKVSLIRGQVAFTSVSQVLFTDYVAAGLPTGWPGGRIVNPVDGAGWIHSVQVANPGAGVDWTLSPAILQRWRLISLNADLAVANSGAARPVEIIVDDGVNVLARMAANAAAPINGTAHVNLSNSGTPSTSIASDLYVQMPSTLVIPRGIRARSVTTNIVAGDSWTNIWALVEEFVNDG